MEKHNYSFTVLVCTLSTHCEGNEDILSYQAPHIAFTLQVPGAY
jgi:hypothetical protein